MQQYIDNMAISTTRVYPSTIVEISGDGGSTWTYQPPTSLSDNSVQVTATLPTLSSANYILRVTNNQQQAISVNLSPGGGGSGGSPTVTAFTIPSTSPSLTTPITTFTATNNTGYCVTTTNSTAGCSWTASAPASVTFGSAGTQTAYAWAKDAASDISAGVSATTTITLSGDTTPPIVTAFTIPSTSTSLAVPVTTFTATDNVGVTGYCVTTTNSSSGCTWSGSAPTSISFSSAGAQKAYAWAKDAAGNISSSASASVTITLSSDTTLFQEGFDDTNFSQRGWYDGGTTGITSSGCYSGSCAQFTFASGASTPSAPYAGAMRMQFTPTNSVYMSYWIKYASNWKEQTGNFHHEIYLLTNQDAAYSGLAFTHLTGYVEHWGTYNQAVSIMPEISLQDGYNINQSDINVDLTSTSENRSTSGCNGASDSYTTTCYNAGAGTYYNGKTIPGTPSSLSIGSWHHVEAYFKLNDIVNGKGVANGTVAYWLDGVQQIQHNDVMMRTGEYPNMQFNQFVIGPYMGSGSPQAQSFWMDSLLVSTTSPYTSGMTAPSIAVKSFSTAN
jgi:hypothetical protein